ncbi:hypothetical protein EDC04DRAFT_2718262 [Pisolithus marmoratus]|nr:hypothetical protein EDC04DRAFT_2718262 [Pisolithus marmoratus]
MPSAQHWWRALLCWVWWALYSVLRLSGCFFVPNTLFTPIYQMPSEPADSTIVNELNKARATLAALERREQELLDQLRQAHLATQAQRVKVEELVRQFPRPPISSLPNELLLRIFKLSLGAATLEDGMRSPDPLLSRKQGLAGVSRHWRDVILNSPSLWTTIVVTPFCTEASMKVNLRRSSQDTLKDWFAMLVPHAHRWRSFAIRDNVSEAYIYAIMDKLQHLTFPSLTRISMSNVPISPPEELAAKPVFLRPNTCPRLKYLNLVRGFSDAVDFRVPTSTTTLSLDFGFDLIEENQHWIPALFDSLSSLQLTSLTLAGYVDISNYHLTPNSIQLPLLEKFVCNLSHAKALVQAIVTPSLSHMECRHPGSWDDSPKDIFVGLESKFTSVHCLTLSELYAVFQDWDSKETKDICRAFPNIRHLILDKGDAELMLQPDVAAHWQHLQSLTIHSDGKDTSRLLERLPLWLKQRLDLGRPVIRVRFNGLMSGRAVSSLYGALHRICVLEWLGVIYHPEVVIYGTVAGQPWLEILEVSDPFPSFTNHPGNVMSIRPTQVE